MSKYKTDEERLVNVNKLLIDEPTLLDKIRDNQRNCKDVDGAITIAKKVIELFKDNS